MTTVVSRGELYAEVQQFYADQMRRLDDRDFTAFAETFVADGELVHAGPQPPARTRADIVAVLTADAESCAGDPMRCRHRFNTMSLRPQEDGTIASTAYANVFRNRPGTEPRIEMSCVVHDVLVRIDSELRNRSRRIVPD
ncbi:nuclear transport factor 2 family protein [Nocardia sp. BSTN01]|uniref:nuclear transport factor 2 family protein n=1 Tax=Nocardia sp. BSTN01 TaxID=2783665 RepID=UPI002815AE41|nr:nuclear transport factor 2 family protein [Nocardia sp. BSTN01]